MKIKKIICFLVILVSLSSCKAKKENYQSKDVKVDTIFDSDFSYDDTEERQLESLSKMLKKGIDDIPDLDDNKESNLKKGEKYTIANETELRKDPSEDENNVIEKIPANTKVELIKNLNVDGEKWSKISYNGNEGYVKRNSLK